MGQQWVGIGEIRQARHEDTLATVLGSCVSTILWHRHCGTALMNHVLLPQRALAGAHDAGHYADESWALMCGWLARRGMSLQECHGFVVGGGHGRQLAVQHIGERNASRALTLLQQARVPVAACDVGGAVYRTIQFCVATGRLQVSHGSTDVDLPAAMPAEARCHGNGC